MSDEPIRLRGVRVHNLRSIDLDIPRNRLVVICGVSGAGKSSLALDTLYAEGQRRYIESFPAHTRQFLQKLDRPDADLIEGIPPAVTVSAAKNGFFRRTTVGTTADLAPLLQLLFARLGTVTCPSCGREIRQDSPQTVAHYLLELPPNRRLLLTFPLEPADRSEVSAVAAGLQEEGFVRAVIGEETVELSDAERVASCTRDGDLWLVVADRLQTGRLTSERLRESLETAFTYGEGRCAVLIEEGDDSEGARRLIDRRSWSEIRFSVHWSCEACQCQVPQPEPNLFNPWSPLGACERCEGSGTVRDWDIERVISDPTRTILGGAVTPWTEKKFPVHLSDFLGIAETLEVRVGLPWEELSERERTIVWEGDAEGRYAGVLQELEQFAAQTKGAARKRLDKWKDDFPCPQCRGSRLRPEGMAVLLGGRSIAEVGAMPSREVQVWLAHLDFAPWQRPIADTLVPQLRQRLAFLEQIGLGYLSPNRPIESLSRGEAQRVAFTSALGSNLVNLLYVLDEPTVGLHPHDIERLVETMTQLRDRGSTVVVVDHSEAVLQAADLVVEIGPAAGTEGGRLEFVGTVDELLEDEHSLTSAYLTGRRRVTHGETTPRTAHGWLQLKAASGHNLRDVSVGFPLGVLCMVTGVSGAGKSSLVHDTLYAELARRKQTTGPKPLPFASLEGSENIEDVVWIDHRAPTQTARSNPVTYVRAFGEIRRVFAESVEARIHNYTPGHFSFNVEGGRCEECKGEGTLSVDMQFLSNVRMTCPVCRGKRFRDTILEVTYRGRNISQVLQMTVREAFRFFRGEKKVQSLLQRLMDVGLDYLQLGQPLDTLSSGEAQRLKLAGQLAASSRRRTLYLLEEPSSGLHDADLVKLLDCFDSLLAVGHSLIVIEHNLKLIAAADYVIDLGPGAAGEGGRVVAKGTPRTIMESTDSVTGRYLRAKMEENEPGSSADQAGNHIE